MDDLTRKIQEGYLLVAKLERLSADSGWAHKASGLRGSLLRQLAQLEDHPEDFSAAQMTHLQALTATAFDILEKAAREIPES
jgi:hypothetical protein